MPTGLVAPGHTGKPQLRTTTQIGVRWSETYPPLKRSAASTHAFLAVINDYWRNQTIFQIDHRARRALFGAGGGTPLVNGVSQTGSNLVTDGWPNNTVVLKQGDIILIGGLTPVYEVTGDVTSNGLGQATITINPPLFSGSSPADNAAVTTNATPGSVTYRARIESWTPPSAGPNEAYVVCTVNFGEVL